MSPEQWKSVRALFDEVVDAAPGSREALLAASGASPETIAEVRAMLARHDSDSDRLDRIPAGMASLQPFVFQTFFPGEKAAGRFEIRQLLGRGGMGEVYEAVDLELGETIALKALQPGLAVNEEALERFKREIQLSRRVTHPNVCRIFDLFVHEPANGRAVLFLTMELVVGGTLSQALLDQGPYSAESAMPVLRQIVSALDAAHAARVVHRDLKSSNVLLEKSTGRVAVTDFGLARSLEEAAGSSMDGTKIGVGTPAYMAPEQMEGGVVTPATDVYALGVVIYEMVTGRLPFAGGTAMALAVQKLKEKPPPASAYARNLPAHWDAVIERCLEYKAQDRFAEAPDVLRALDGEIPAKAASKASWNRPVMAVCAAILSFAGMEAMRRPTQPSNDAAARYLASAEEALEQRSFPRARNLTEESLKSDPEHYRTHARLAQALMELDQIEKARDHMIRAATLLPGWWRITRWEKHEFAAIQHSVLRDFRKAAEGYREALSTAPAERRPGLRLALAAALEDGEFRDEAVREYESLLKDRPDFAAAALRLGRLVATTKGLEAGLPLLREAARRFEVERNTDMTLEAKLEAAIAMREQRKLSESLAELDALVRDAEAKGAEAIRLRVLSEKAIVTALMGRFDDALAQSRALLESASNSGHRLLALYGLHDLVIANLTQYRWKEAEAIANQVIEQASEQKARFLENAARVNMAAAQGRQGKKDVCVKTASRALEFYRGIGDIRGSIAALSAMVNAALAPPMDVAQAQALVDEFGKAARASGNLRIETRALSNEAHMAAVARDYPKASGIHRTMRLAYAKLGMPQQRVRSFYQEAQFLAALGAEAEAADLLAEGQKAAEGLQARSLVEMESETRLWLAVSSRHPENGVRLADELAPKFRDVAVWAYLAGGATDKAWQTARTLLDGHKSNGRGDAEVGLAWAELQRGRTGEAAAIASRLEPADAEMALRRSLVAAAALCSARGAGCEDAKGRVNQDFARIAGSWSTADRLRYRNRPDLQTLWKWTERQSQ
ncbi:MAG: hypothetical protein FJW30_28950 [Acidobacteria bacterium]|nr:hypothetical protein [Acidobacteriota bacterium]